MAKTLIQNIHVIAVIFLILFPLAYILQYSFVYLVANPEYTRVMNNISSDECKAKMLEQFDSKYDYVELLSWVKSKLKWDTTIKLNERSEDPLKILKFGRGMCQEFAILYTSACLANGYKARLVMSYFVDGHAWVEVKVGGRWVTVEAVDGEIDQPLRRWENGKRIMLVIAYESNHWDDVTLNYRAI